MHTKTTTRTEQTPFAGDIRDDWAVFPA
jgi:hypothetical protein